VGQYPDDERLSLLRVCDERAIDSGPFGGLFDDLIVDVAKTEALRNDSTNNLALGAR
jgi:hypothetical protein